MWPFSSAAGPDGAPASDAEGVPNGTLESSPPVDATAPQLALDAEADADKAPAPAEHAEGPSPVEPEASDAPAQATPDTGTTTPSTSSTTDTAVPTPSLTPSPAETAITTPSPESECVAPKLAPPPESPSLTDSITTQDMPPLDFCWMHSGTKVLNLPSAPVTIDRAYRTFSYAENGAIEDAWCALSPRRRDSIVRAHGAGDAEWGQDAKATRDREHAKELRLAQEAAAKWMKSTKKIAASPAASLSSSPDSKGSQAEEAKTEADPAVVLPLFDTRPRLPIGQDALFEVDIEKLALLSVFWQNVPRIPVIRGTWFLMDETRPLTWDLAREVEEGYKQTKPWEQEYQERFSAAKAKGTEHKLKWKLSASFGSCVAVIFEDAVRCRIVTAGAFDYISRHLLPFGPKPGDNRLYRGYSAAVIARETRAKEEAEKNAKNTKNAPAVSATPAAAPDSSCTIKSETRSIKSELEAEAAAPTEDEPSAEPETIDPVQRMIDHVRNEWDSKRNSLDGGAGSIFHGYNEDKPCTDLIIAIHGIGQNLAIQYEGLNFVYSVNQLRTVMQRQSVEPSLKSLIKDRRAQIVPVLWRANLDEHGHDDCGDPETHYTMEDVTIKNSIPYVRQLMHSVLLDIPLFMSQHRRTMIEAVCQEANKVYRQWLARNPGFEENGGKVHILGHSLGSALASHILSNQPSSVPPVSSLSPDELEANSKQAFLFNTDTLFFIGSPMGMFMQLEQAQLVPRTGRGKIPAPPEDSISEPGHFGCLAVDSLYNVFYSTDPVANTLNATIDVATARSRPPLVIPGAPLATPLPLLPAFPTLPVLPTLPPFGQLPPLRNWHSFLPGYAKKDKEEAKELTPQMILGEKRFAELNPHGSVDFMLPSTGLNNYLDAVTAHLNYWTDPTFGAFVLAEMFASEAEEAKSAVKQIADAAAGKPK